MAGVWMLLGWIGAPCLACGGDAVPTHTAKQQKLMGDACSFATSRMAQRIVREGQHYSYIGSLRETDTELDSRVAAPFTIGPESDIFVLANEVLDGLVREGADLARIELAGRVLEVEGVTYFVATEWSRV